VLISRMLTGSLIPVEILFILKMVKLIWEAKRIRHTPPLVVIMVVCLVVGSYYSISPIIICSGCAVLHVLLICQFERRREDKLWLKDHIF